MVQLGHMPFTLIAEGAGFQIANVGSLLITTHTQTASLSFCDRLRDTMSDHRSRYPRFSTLSVVSGTGIKQPEAGVKERSVELEKTFEKTLIAASVVIEAKGLAAIFTRGFLVGYTLLSSHKFPFQSFGSVDAGVTWLKTLSDQEPGLLAATDIGDQTRLLLDRALGADRAA